jgi:flagellar basal-body rod protein FlgB
MKALDGLSVRAAATAENIANAGSADFRPVRVRFEEALAAAAKQGRQAVNGVQPVVETDPTVPAGVRLDLELATASETALRYSALTDLLGRQLQMHSIAVTGSR